MTTLSLFPSRIRFTNADGTLTPEAYRALQVLFNRVGGALGDNGEDVFGSVSGQAQAHGESITTETIYQSVMADFVSSDVVQPVSFVTDYYGDIVQSVASSNDINGFVLPDVVQPISKDREAGTFTTIDVSGNAVIGGTLSLAAGTVGLPSLYWSTDTTTGFYRIGANNNGYAVSGVKLLDFLSTGLAVLGTLENTGLLTNFSNVAKTASSGTIIRLMRSNDVTNYAAIQGSFTGAAAAANRVFSLQTIEQGVANAGILSLQPDGGDVRLAAGGGVTTTGGLLTTPGGATFHTTNTALTNGAAAAAGTLLNAPVAGNPTKWIGINDNGTVRQIPCW